MDLIEKARRQLPLLSVAVGVVSAFIPISHDEGDWLAATRRVAFGNTLYKDILSNKTPPFMWLVRALDALPGPYVWARAAFVGVCTGVAGVLVARLCLKLGAGERAASGIGFAAAVAVPLQSAFVLDIEKPALILILAGTLLVASHRTVLGAIVSSSAVAFDIRAALFAVAVTVFVRELHGKRRAVWAALACAATLGGPAAAVLLVSDLRYSLLELNAATRSATGFQPLPMIVVTVASLLPMLVLSFVALRAIQVPETLANVRLSAPAFLGIAAIIGIASRFPFYKYWLLAIPGCALAGLVFWPRMRKASVPLQPAFVIFVAALAIAPSATHVVVTSIEQASTMARYERAAKYVNRTVPAGRRYVTFDAEPYLATLLPEKAAMSWTVLDLIGIQTSRTTMEFARTIREIQASDAIIDDGALSVGEQAVIRQYRPLWRLFRDRLEDFPCIRRVDGLTVRFRAGVCPPG